MKKIFKSVLTLSLVAGLGFAANAQVAANSPASATILSALSIAHDGTAINFGTISNTTATGVVLDANGVTNVNTGTDRSVARFNVEGSAGAEITVVYDGTVDLISDSAVDPADPTASELIVMTPEVVGSSDIDDQEGASAIVSAGAAVTIGTVDAAAGKYYIWVGGILTAAADPYASGTYAGTFNISVEYN